LSEEKNQLHPAAKREEEDKGPHRHPAAQNFALIIRELATNAIKNEALS
jgi:two-component sensor histidine kinase